MSHIPEDRHKDGLVLDYNLAENLVLKRYHTKELRKRLLRFKKIYSTPNRPIGMYDIRRGRGRTPSRSMSGGNRSHHRARNRPRPRNLLAVQPPEGWTLARSNTSTSSSWPRGRGQGRSARILELDEDGGFDRILVMYEGEIAADLTRKPPRAGAWPYMAGSKREAVQ